MNGCCERSSRDSGLQRWGCSSHNPAIQMFWTKPNDFDALGWEFQINKARPFIQSCGQHCLLSRQCLDQVIITCIHTIPWAQLLPYSTVVLYLLYLTSHKYQKNVARPLYHSDITQGEGLQPQLAPPHEEKWRSDQGRAAICNWHWCAQWVEGARDSHDLQSDWAATICFPSYHREKYHRQL